MRMQTLDVEVVSSDRGTVRLTNCPYRCGLKKYIYPFPVPLSPNETTDGRMISTLKNNIWSKMFYVMMVFLVLSVDKSWLTVRETRKFLKCLVHTSPSLLADRLTSTSPWWEKATNYIVCDLSWDFFKFFVSYRSLLLWFLRIVRRWTCWSLSCTVWGRAVFAWDRGTR